MRARRAMRMVGTAAVVFGSVALLWALVTWQWGDPATSLYTRWEQRSLEASYRQVRDRYAIPPESRRTVDPAAAIRTAARRLRLATTSGHAIGRLEIPRLDLDMVLVDGTDAPSLRKGPGLDRRTFMPGEGELSYVAGHRTTFGAPFAHIDRLEAGDRVVLRMPYATLVYRVSRHVIVSADDIARLHSSGREMVALQACHPRFSARERYIVYARPVRAIPAYGRASGLAVSTGASAASPRAADQGERRRSERSARPRGEARSSSAGVAPT